MTLILNQKVKNTSVSVIVPTCNRRDMLGRCLSSILSQTLQPFEIIVVNDAGEPVADIIAEHNSSGLIRYETHTTNQGASAARNTGLRLAKGAYIAYLDDDDTYLPSHLQMVVSALQSSECRFGYSYAEYVIDDLQDGAVVNLGRVQPYSDIPYSRDRLLVSNFIPTPTWVFERTLLESVGYFDEHFAACEDWEWLIRASEKTDFLTVPIVSVEVRQRLHDNQHLIVQHGSKMNLWIKAVYKKHPVVSPRLQMARQEQLTFGAAKSLNSAQGQWLMTAIESAKNQSLELVQLINIAEMLTMANLRWRAVELYQVWIKHNGHSPLRHAALFNLSVSLKSLGQDAEADAACRAAIEISPKFNMARFLLASFQEQKGNINEALQIWVAIANQEPNSTTADSKTALNHIKRHSVQY